MDHKNLNGWLRNIYPMMTMNKKNLIYTKYTVELLETIDGDVQSDESNGMATKELLKEVYKVQKGSIHISLINIFRILRTRFILWGVEL